MRLMKSRNPTSVAYKMAPKLKLHATNKMEAYERNEPKDLAGLIGMMLAMEFISK